MVDFRGEDLGPLPSIYRSGTKTIRVSAEKSFEGSSTARSSQHTNAAQNLDENRLKGSLLFPLRKNYSRFTPTGNGLPRRGIVNWLARKLSVLEI